MSEKTKAGQAVGLEWFRQVYTAKLPGLDYDLLAAAAIEAARQDVTTSDGIAEQRRLLLELGSRRPDPTEDERAHCERVAYAYYDATPKNPEVWQLPELLLRERADARMAGGHDGYKAGRDQQGTACLLELAELQSKHTALVAAAREYKRLFESEEDYADAYDARCALWALIKEDT